MCRQSLNFRGLHRLEEKWSEEARQQQIDDLFGEFIDEALDGCDWFDFIMFEIEEAQKRLHQIYDWDFNKDLFEAVLYDSILLAASTLPREYDEPRTFEHTLFAQKSPIRKENPGNSVHAREFSTAASDVFDVLVIV
tara:strand:+ start:1525 stop:1935 length:411 start_codon:yes stop_codon:yes gene_type:complete